MEVVVRPLERGDIAASVALILGGTLAPEGEDPSNIDAYWNAAEAIRQTSGEVLVAELDGEVVGVLQVIVFRHFQHTGGLCCELESFHVRSDLRSRGIGAQMLRQAEEMARRLGCWRMQLTSRNVREDAHRFYRTNGYDQNSQGFKKLL